MNDRKLRLGVAGLGRGFMLMLPTLANHPLLQLVAAADPRTEARRQFEVDFAGKSYASVDELCCNSEVEAVYIATPHQYHVAHVEAAAAHGKHVLVEKPMALTLSDCRAMIAAARKGRIRLLVGHSHSFNGPIRRARELIASGSFGRVRMIHAVNFTDFLYRPRRPEELDTARGGGVVFSQGAHHVDIVRLLGGGRVRSVRAATGNWDPNRATEGAYGAFITFEDGTFASMTYSGYAHFDTDAFCDWIGETGQERDAQRYGTARASLRDISGPEQEAVLKNTRAYGVEAASKKLVSAQHHSHFGLIVASCERADLRPDANGVEIYEDYMRRFEPVPMPVVPRGEVIDELYDAVVRGHPTIHTGEWGLATIEVCLAILTSAVEGREIILSHQIGLGQQRGV